MTLAIERFFCLFQSANRKSHRTRPSRPFSPTTILAAGWHHIVLFRPSACWGLLGGTRLSSPPAPPPRWPRRPCLDFHRFTWDGWMDFLKGLQGPTGTQLDGAGRETAGCERLAGSTSPFLGSAVALACSRRERSRARDLASPANFRALLVNDWPLDNADAVIAATTCRLSDRGLTGGARPIGRPSPIRLPIPRLTATSEAHEGNKEELREEIAVTHGWMSISISPRVPRPPHRRPQHHPPTGCKSCY